MDADFSSLKAHAHNQVLFARREVRKGLKERNVDEFFKSDIESGRCAQLAYDTNAPKMIAQIHLNRLTGELIDRCVKICGVFFSSSYSYMYGPQQEAHDSNYSIKQNRFEWIWMNENEKKRKKTNKRSVGF